MAKAKKRQGPVVGTLDIETSPAVANVWGMFDQNLSVSQIIKRRSVIAVAIKILDDDKVLYFSTAGQRDLRDDRRLLRWVRKQINKLDVLITQNGKKFDLPILLGRMAVHGIAPPKPVKHIDTCQIARGLGFMSSKLENLTAELCPELLKSIHKNFPGMSLWTEFLAGNKRAQLEMEKYNKQDVRGTEGVWKKLAPFAKGQNTINFNLYHGDTVTVCHCGSTRLRNKGYVYTNTGKFQSYRCLDCGLYHKGRENLLSKEKRLSLKGVA